MGGPILTDQAGSIDRQRDIQLLEGYVMYQLVVAALQKRLMLR